MSELVSEPGDAKKPVEDGAVDAPMGEPPLLRPNVAESASEISPLSLDASPDMSATDASGDNPWESDVETRLSTTRRTKDERSHRRHVRIEIAAVVALVAAALGALVGYGVSPPSATAPRAVTTLPTSTVPSNRQNSDASGAPSNAAALAAATDPALVDINVTDRYQAVTGAATGMVLSSNGEVLTNNHVVEGATSISVVDVGNHKTYHATVVGYDVSQDVAVLRLTEASGLHTVKLGHSSAVNVGDGVVVVGNANGTGGTPSYAGGSVTALDQAITAQDQASGATEQLTGLIETNADVIPGDSGGAMVNGAGRVVGMTCAASESYQFQSSSTQGYGIPIHQALLLARQIEAGQPSSTVHVGSTAFLGILTQSLPFGYLGAEVVEIVSGSAAAKAGLSPGDVITSVDGQAVTSPASLTGLVLSETPGASMQLGYQDPSGQQHAVTVRLGTGPAQ